jgi:hypothetical protein
VSTGRALALTLLAGLVVRAPFWGEALRTPVDGDTAIVGLMARHPGQGTTLWGQPYGSPLDAWVAMPFVAALGPRVLALRLPVFLLGLLLIPAAFALGRFVHPRGGLPAALLLACPPPYLLLLSALAPPFYATTLILCGALLILAISAGRRLAAGERPVGVILLWGALSGLALWTHLMSASTIAVTGGFLFWRMRARPRLLLAAALPLLVSSVPLWTRLLIDFQAASIVRVSGREETMGEHLREVLPRLHEPLGGLLGTHVPLIADDAEHLVRPPRIVAIALIGIEALLFFSAVRAARANPAAQLMLATAGLALAAFPFPARSASHTIRFLAPLALPFLVLLATAARQTERALLAVLALSAMHLLGGARLLGEWRRLDRAEAPFLLPDLAPVREALLARGARRAYASYGPAYRLTWESGEQIIASQPWNERFRHYPLPFLDEVRFAKNVAWVLTPKIPTDLPAPPTFEAALGAIGGAYRRAEVGPATLYTDFAPPFSPQVEPWPGAGAAGDGDLDTHLTPETTAPITFRLPSARPLDAVTLIAGRGVAPLLRSMDVEVTADGVAFETVARRRRREEREDLRWVNGHPQFVIDHDLIAVPLGGRVVSAVRISPVASSDPWSLAELLLHPAEDPAHRRPWDEWLDPGRSWRERRQELSANPRRDREDWYYRSRVAATTTANLPR